MRINPEELHFDDIAFVDEIYAGGGRKRDKQQHFLNFVAGPIVSSMFATLDHDHHRIRRSAMNKFFSRAQILKLESNIRELVDQLCDKMIRLGRSYDKEQDSETASNSKRGTKWRSTGRDHILQLFHFRCHFGLLLWRAFWIYIAGKNDSHWKRCISTRAERII